MRLLRQRGGGLVFIAVAHDAAERLGLPFMDDVLDFMGTEEELGKPVGNDLLQGVLTLPTIMLMERHPDDNPIASLFEDPTQDGKVRQILEMINNSSIIEDCYAIIREYSQKASHCLDILPQCEARRSLLHLCDYIWERSR